MTEYLNPNSEMLFPHSLPEDTQAIIWRYMDDWKFNDMIKKHRLYLCRGDKLQDRFEGTYSRAQIVDQNRWLKEKGLASLIEQGKRERQENRRSFYINSWCMYEHDLDLMWKSYTKVCRSVAVQSRVAKLVAVCESDSVLEYDNFSVHKIKYIHRKEGEFINYFPTGFEPFVHKDHHFSLDNEIRLIHWNPNQSLEGFFLSVDLSTVIERVVLSPNSTSKDAESVRILLNDAGLENIPIESSRYELDLTEME